VELVQEFAMGAVENPTATVGFLFTGVAKAKK